MSAPLAFRTSSAVILTAPSDLGHLAVAVRGRQIVGVSIGHPAGRPAALRLAKMLSESVDAAGRRGDRSADEQLAGDALARLVDYMNGEPTRLDDLPVALDHLTPFQRRVAAACRAIPRGRTQTYGELAAAAGAPGAARAVGQVMASNRTPLVVPCHRVVAAGGGLGGFSAPQGLVLKRRLLAMEAEGIADKPPVGRTKVRPRRVTAAAR